MGQSIILNLQDTNRSLNDLTKEDNTPGNLITPFLNQVNPNPHIKDSTNLSTNKRNDLQKIYFIIENS